MPSERRERSKVVDGLAREAVVAGHGVGDERLDARVAHVLQLLVVGAVHVGLVRAGSGGAPADLPEAPERRVPGVEAAALLEGVAGEVHGQAVEGERLGGGLHLDPHVAPRAPPQRVEDASRAAVRDDLVLVADEALALEVVAVALLPGLRGLEERFLVAGSGSATRGRRRTSAPGRRSRASSDRREARPSCSAGRGRGRSPGSPRRWRPRPSPPFPPATVRYSIGGSSSGTSRRPSGVSW